MKIYKKGMMYDSDPSLHVSKLENGKLLTYAMEQDTTMDSVLKRSVLL